MISHWPARHLVLEPRFHFIQNWSCTISPFSLALRPPTFILLLWTQTIQPNNTRNIRSQYQHTLTILIISVLLCSLLALYIGLYTAYLFQHQLMPSSSSTNVRSKQLLVEGLGRLLFACLFGGQGKGEWQWLLILKMHERFTPSVSLPWEDKIQGKGPTIVGLLLLA